MQKDYEYYFNRMPGRDPWRNNLIYTSLISNDKKTFCKWFYNDPKYHKNQNEVVDPALMTDKFEREVRMLTKVYDNFPQHVPEILDIDYSSQKIFLKVDGDDFWQRSLTDSCSYDDILVDWQEQMIDIIKAHKSLGLYKYSMHPSSYFIVNGKLKSINYFFCYHKDEGPIRICDHSSHIYHTRQDEMKKYITDLGIGWDSPEPLNVLEKLCWNSFRSHYPEEFINRVI